MNDFKPYGWLLGGLACWLAWLEIPCVATHSGHRASSDKIVFVRHGDLWVMDADGRNQAPLLQTEVREEEPAASPDGELIAYQVYNAAQEGYDLEVLSMDTLATRPLVANGSSPAWSPTADRVAFVSSRNGSLDIWVVDRNGQNLRPITRDATQEISPCWQPDGERLAYIALTYQKDDQGRILTCHSAVRIWHPSGRIRTVLTLPETEMVSLDWSVRGDLALALQPAQAPRAAYQLWIVSPEGKRRRLSLPDQVEAQPAWSPDGQSLALVRYHNSHRSIWISSPRGPHRRNLSGPGGDDSWPTFLPGGIHRAVRLFVRGQRTFVRPGPRVEGQDVLLPVREVARAWQLSFRWEPESPTLELGTPNRKLRLNLRAQAAKLNGKPIALPVFPRLIQGVTMVPVVRFGHIFDQPVVWQPEERQLELAPGVENRKDR